MSTIRGNALETANSFLRDAQLAAVNAKGQYEKQARKGRLIAYTLKAIALFGGLFVATIVPLLKLNPILPGLVISAAIILDQLTSNYRRMLSYTVAASAVDRTQRRVGNRYNDQLVPIQTAIGRGGEKKANAEEKLVTLAADSAKALRDELDKIHTAVEDSNIEFLSALNIDQPVQTRLPDHRI